ncbi:Protein of unknown function [Malonomonas rubra DSM 5091]|uniref:Methylase n=1 Tax=Malonomonas rubra DSM 5091 TaxID=1122189 RepID=A0A1M6BK12_MALRU|nr:DUF938 domain-containing protein [Malonomonas rubra]SHI49044.1 Protein of unknown function [Malonomonas rubra DSM 5091]
MKNYSESCERNREPILDVLRQELAETTDVLEIGSGSGQHALFLSVELPHLQWQPSERPKLIDDLRGNLRQAAENVVPAAELDVTRLPWAVESFAAIFSANTLHIMPIEAVADFFAGVGQVLLPGGKLCVYGPFNYNGKFTSESNARFDRGLKEKDPERGIRDFEQLNRFAEQNGLELLNDHEMPSNNRLLVWRKIG